jgi:hypothetical protein
MRLVMRKDFTRCTLLALLSLGLVSCASGNSHEQESQMPDTSGAQSTCNFAKFSAIESSPCTDSALHRSVHLLVKTTPERARDECAKLADFVSLQTEYQPRWMLEIASPASGDSSCTVQLPDLGDVPASLLPVIQEVLVFAISIYTQEATEMLKLMISILQEMREPVATDE